MTSERREDTKPSPEEIAKAIIEEYYDGLSQQIGLRKLITQAIERERQRTMPSYSEYFEAYKKHDPSFCNEFDLRWAYDWIESRMR